MTKITLITGATSGIGKATAYKCAELGHNLVLTGRRYERLEEIKKELILKYKIEVQILCFDIRNKNEVESSFNSLSDNWKNIDILINNAGLAAGSSSIEQGNLDDWEQMIDTNIKGLLYISKLVTPYMIARKQGHIVNIGSIAGKEVYPNGNVYCASKHAVDAITKGMRIDLLKHNIKVSQVAPGMVETEFSMVRFKGDKNLADNVYKGLTPLYADDIAETIVFVITRPKHVNINDILVMPTNQANTSNVLRES